MSAIYPESLATENNRKVFYFEVIEPDSSSLVILGNSVSASLV
jgi:hypothetical protein